MTDKYSDIQIPPVCEVSGPDDYVLRISLRKNEGRWQHYFKPLQATFLPKEESGIENAPLSLHQTVMEAVWQALKDDEIMFYELDEGGNKKFSGLQYHDLDQFMTKFKAKATELGANLS